MFYSLRIRIRSTCKRHWWHDESTVVHGVAVASSVEREI